MRFDAGFAIVLVIKAVLEERPATCTCPSASTACPECGTTVATAAPFSRSGKQTAGSCPDHGPRPILTKLHRALYVDERGYRYCPGCGLVLEDIVLRASREVGEDAMSEHLRVNHYARLVTSRGVQPNTVQERVALSSTERSRITRLTVRLYDAETLLSALAIKGDAKAEALAAVEAFFSDDARSGGGQSYEALLSAVVEEVLVARGIGFETDALWSHFPRVVDSRLQARRRAGTWFQSYAQGALRSRLIDRAP